MPPIRAVLLIVLAALAAVWAFSSGAPGGDAAVGTPRPTSAPVPARQPAVFDLQVLPERIDAHRASLAETPLNGRRNPFAFASEPRASGEPRSAQPLGLRPSDVPAEAPAPAATLIGIVDRTVDGQAVRVAVVSLDGELYYVRAGERVGSRYEAASVSTDAVELKDLTDGSTRRLLLR